MGEVTIRGGEKRRTRRKSRGKIKKKNGEGEEQLDIRPRGTRRSGEKTMRKEMEHKEGGKEAA
eukprot:2131912-Pleurochrysis_carterae.AAC.2